MNIKLIITTLLIALGIIGCSKEATSPTSSNQTPIFSISPKDGEANVRLDATITLNFAQPVVRGIVENNLYLMSARGMDDSLHPAGDSMGYGMMNETMMDSMKMLHMMNQHRAKGKYLWNGDSTRCIFTPDSMMISGMQYMVRMGTDMVKMMENRLGDMNMMGNHGNGVMKNEMYYHFTTMDTSKVGSGHNGHH
ncbi:MAG: hypothetical protein HZB59_09980 [Ignavibacteriales bacterium]|nr:hypothetical protein [Ignavibacteriales bacterium]